MGAESLRCEKATPSYIAARTSGKRWVADSPSIAARAPMGPPKANGKNIGLLSVKRLRSTSVS